MKRRNFLNLSALASLAVLSSSALSAKDFRTSNPDVWTAHKVDDAIKNMYGDVSFIKKGITLNTPKVASNGGNVPLEIKSDISAKSLSIFQNANPEAAVIAYTIHENSVIDYTLKIKMQAGPGEITVVLEGRDGKFYSTTNSIVVADGGCDP